MKSINFGGNIKNYEEVFNKLNNDFYHEGYP